MIGRYYNTLLLRLSLADLHFNIVSRIIVIKNFFFYKYNFILNYRKVKKKYSINIGLQNKKVCRD